MSPQSVHPLPFYPYSRYLRERFGGRVRKLCVDAGFTCPNLDGTRGANGCSFCNNAAFSAGSRGLRHNLRDQFDGGRRYLTHRYGESRFIVYFQAFSNTYGPIDGLRKLYRTFAEEPDVVGVAVGTRPDCLDTDTLDLLDDLACDTHVTLEIGVQSVHDRTLQRIRRGHTWSETATILEQCIDRRFDLCLHLILGLPGENRQQTHATAETLAAFPYDSLKLHNLHVVKNTALATPFIAGRLPLLDRATYISWAADFLERTPPTVALQRLVGDAPPDLLLSDSWCHDKQAAYDALTLEFLHRNSRQGARCAQRADSRPISIGA